MTEKLDQLTAELEAANQRLARLNDEMQKSRERLAETRKAHVSAIMDEKDTAKIGRDIVALEKELEGMAGARVQLTAPIRTLEAQRDAEERAIGKVQAEIVKGEYHSLEVGIYALLVDVVKRLPELEKKNAEYRAWLKQAGVVSGIREQERNKSIILRDAIQNGIRELLGHFPHSVMVDGRLPDPDVVKRLLRVR